MSTEKHHKPLPQSARLLGIAQGQLPFVGLFLGKGHSLFVGTSPGGFVRVQFPVEVCRKRSTLR